MRKWYHIIYNWTIFQINSLMQHTSKFQLMDYKLWKLLQGLRSTHKPQKNPGGFFFKKAHSKKPNKSQAQMGFIESIQKFYTFKNSLSFLN